MRVLGEHMDVVASLNNVGVCARHLERWSEASEYFGRAIELAKSILPDRLHPVVGCVPLRCVFVCLCVFVCVCVCVCARALVQ